MTADEVYLETVRMTLRRVRPEDRDILYELDGDPEVMRYLRRDRTPYNVIVDRVIPDILRTYDRFPRYGTWIAGDRASGAFLGWFELTVGSPSALSRPELGYRLARNAWGRGLATEGSRALIDKAFRDLHAKAVYAQTMAVNAASRRVMEKVGMRHVRTFHEEFENPLPGTEHGEVEYEISRDEWLIHRHGNGAKG